jgi:hypothetical protein
MKYYFLRFKALVTYKKYLITSSNKLKTNNSKSVRKIRLSSYITNNLIEMFRTYINHNFLKYVLLDVSLNAEYVS